MKPAQPTTLEEALDRLRKFDRLLAPVWMQLACNALANNDEPEDDAPLFVFEGCGGSDLSTFGAFTELMGNPWEIE